MVRDKRFWVVFVLALLFWIGVNVDIGLTLRIMGVGLILFGIMYAAVNLRRNLRK